MALDVTDPVARIQLVPAADEVLGDQTELDDQHARQVEGGDLATLFQPQAVKGLLVLAHDDPGVGAADEIATIARCYGDTITFGHSSAAHRMGAWGHGGAPNLI